jgi:hypothetical protein
MHERHKEMGGIPKEQWDVQSDCLGSSDAGADGHMIHALLCSIHTAFRLLCKTYFVTTALGGDFIRAATPSKAQCEAIFSALNR